MVFHCCEPEKKLLIFAKKKKIFIGVDGDVTYIKKKQKFVKQIPQDLLVLETDSPFLMPKLSMRRSSHNKNEPKNLPLIAKFISNLLSVSINQLIDTTTENAKRLFSLV
jgi:TatD DNase family protein